MRIYVGEVNQADPGKPFITKVKGKEIGVFYEKGKWYAVKNSCPHKQAPLCKGTVDGTMLPSDVCEFEFGMEGTVLKCPWHGWEFDLNTGKALFGISELRVATYSVEIENGKVYRQL